MRKKNKSYFPSADPQNKSRGKVYVSHHNFKTEKGLSSAKDAFFGLVLFDKGNGLCTMNTQHYPLKARQLHLLFPGRKQQWKIESSTTGQMLIIKRALIETFSPSLQFPFSEHNLHPVLNLNASAYKKINAEFAAIKRELSSISIFQEVVNARCRLISLMINLWMKYQFDSEKPYHSNSLSYKF